MKEEAERHGQLRLEQFLINFEATIAKQVRFIFGRQVRITGCQVHLYKNLRLKMGELGGLIYLQCHQHVLAKFVRAVQGLVYVPPGSVPEYYRALVDSELDKILTKVDTCNLYEADEADNIKMSVRYYLDYLEAN